MPTCQSEKSIFIAFFSRTGVLGRAMQSSGSHPVLCLLFRKTAGRSKERQIAKPRFPAISDPLKERLSLFALRETSHFGPFSALKTGNSNERVTIPPQSLRLYIVLVHSC